MASATIPLVTPSAYYAYGAAKQNQHAAEANYDVTEANVLGILSMIFWLLIIVVSLKYVTFIMRADNRGEGGIMALMALAQRGARDSASLRRGIVILGLLARKDSLRKHAMHFAAMLGLIGFGVSIWRVIVSAGKEDVKPLALGSQAAMAVICAAFVGLCVNSFIQARRARAEGKKG